MSKGLKLSLIAIIGVILFVVSVGIFYKPKNSQNIATKTSEIASAEATESEEIAATTPETYAEVAMRFKSEVADATNEPPPVSLYIADLMAARNVKWDELNNIEKTSYGLVMKDVAKEGMKLLCAQGVVIEIYGFESRQRNKFYDVGLMDNSGKIYRAIATGSTGDLVADSQVKFCGQVTGRINFNNSIGGSTTAAFLVGMFDLPENR